MKSVAASALLLLSASVAYSQSHWDHNGSIVALSAAGSKRQFHYAQPRPGLPVQAGMLLFDGQRSGNQYSGKAYLFSQTCGASAYAVVGPVAADQRTVTMHGKAPRLAADCRVVGYRNDTLVFTLRSEVTAGARPSLVIRIGANATAFHDDPCGTGERDIVVFAATPQVARDFTVLMAEANMSGIEVREANIQRNACALWVGNSRFIILGNILGGDKADGDEDEIRGLDIATLAHEIGHHVCRHRAYTSNIANNWKQELEADQFAGMLLGRMFRSNRIPNWNNNPEEFLAVVVDSLQRGGNYAGGKTHPPNEMRRNAVREGFLKGSPCLDRS